MKSLFPLGVLITTEGINNELSNSIFENFCVTSLKKHHTGDWGDLCDEDKILNNEALKENGRIFSCYNFDNEIKVNFEEKIYIITEWDRSVTTILFPSEY